MLTAAKRVAAPAPAIQSDDWIEETVPTLPVIMTTAETMGFLRLSRRHFYRLVADGRIKTLKQSEANNARHMVPRAEIARYLRSLAA